jgi:hypothetical protein
MTTKHKPTPGPTLDLDEFGDPIPRRQPKYDTPDPDTFVYRPTLDLDEFGDPPRREGK